MSDACPFCECDPCDCNWGIYGFEKGNPDRISVTSGPWWECDGDNFDPILSPPWSYYDDCVEHDYGPYGASGFTGVYKGSVVLNLVVGDLVRYFPNSNLTCDQGIWIIRNVINKHSLDSSWYDYEITDGCRSVLCTQSEVFKLEV